MSLENNSDYFLLRYLPGGALGLRELSENFADVARVSAKGTLTVLEFGSLEEMSLILLIAESAEDMRRWAEQVLPETQGARLLAATGYAAEPLAQVYADSMEEIVGLIVGFRDAYTYGEKLVATYGRAQPKPVAERAAARTGHRTGAGKRGARSARGKRTPDRPCCSRPPRRSRQQPRFQPLHLRRPILPRRTYRRRPTRLFQQPRANRCYMWRSSRRSW